MPQITGRLFVRAEEETEYQSWERLTKEERRRISECLNREAAHFAGFQKSRQKSA